MRLLLIRSLLLLLLIGTSIFLLDKPLAQLFYHYLPVFDKPAGAFTLFWDTLTTNLVLLWAVLAGCGLLLVLTQKNKMYGMVFGVAILVNLSSSLVTGQLKAATLRTRPQYYFQHPDAADFFNREVRGDSFPSGHASFYWGLFLPFAMIFRRYATFLAAVPVLISIARMAQTHHYLSDVLASFTLAWWLSIVVLAVSKKMLNIFTQQKKDS